MGLEDFSSVMSCDVCGFTAAGQQVGTHISNSHRPEIKKRILDTVFNSGGVGITTHEVAEATGWKLSRVTNSLRHFRKEGLLVSNRRGHSNAYYSAQVAKDLGLNHLFESDPASDEFSEDEVLVPEPVLVTIPTIVDVAPKDTLSKVAFDLTIEELIKTYPDQFLVIYRQKFLEAAIETVELDDVLAKVATIAESIYG